MGFGVVGNDAIDRDGTSDANWTSLDLTNPAQNPGIIKILEVYGANAGTAKIKIFRDDGSNYVFIYEHSVNISTGYQQINVWLPVAKGDLIGIYSTVNAIERATSGGSQAYKSGDVTSTLPKGDWSTNSRVLSMKGWIFARSGVI